MYLDIGKWCSHRSKFLRAIIPIFIMIVLTIFLVIELRSPGPVKSAENTKKQINATYGLVAFLFCYIFAELPYVFLFALGLINPSDFVPFHNFFESPRRCIFFFEIFFCSKFFQHFFFDFKYQFDKKTSDFQSKCPVANTKNSHSANARDMRQAGAPLANTFFDVSLLLPLKFKIFP
ncbi:Protein CBG11280 [Caenorhabditis briggsae]|uniref:Protein CBG11280 n=1 Tax=Caenorhabditis briggsae TaxID=6238 RepID=A8XDE0_CAEBR|nr:Protein CBG11280 [Caenorhabditis briggsae]CAP30659.1 Protein CBG11280 [Caenorhabditis briggsae]